MRQEPQGQGQGQGQGRLAGGEEAKEGGDLMDLLRRLSSSAWALIAPSTVRCIWLVLKLCSVNVQTMFCSEVDAMLRPCTGCGGTLAWRRRTSSSSKTVLARTARDLRAMCPWQGRLYGDAPLPTARRLGPVCSHRAASRGGAPWLKRKKCWSARLLSTVDRGLPRNRLAENNASSPQCPCLSKCGFCPALCTPPACWLICQISGEGIP